MRAGSRNGWRGARETPDLPGRSETVFQWFRWYARRYVARQFHAVRVLSAPDMALLRDRPVIICLNHPAWWDPLVGLVLNGAYFTDRRHFAPIDSEMLKRYGFFRWLGFFGIDADARRGAAQFLRTGARLLSAPEAMMWVTVEGRFSDPRERPVRLEPGAARLAHRLGDVALLPLALEYPFWTESSPEALAHFGRPVLPTTLAEGSAQAIHAALRDALERAMDELAEAAMRKRADAFHTLLQRPSGVGGVYEQWQRCRAWARGQRYRPGHLDQEG